MGFEAVLAGLLYANPIALCATLFACNIIFSNRNHIVLGDEFRAKRRQQLFHAIWWVQSLLVVIWLISASLNIRPWLDAIKATGPYKLYEAYLTSCIAVFLFFTAGLLPDPEGPFTPKFSNFYAWIPCMVLDVAALLAAYRSGLFPGAGHDAAAVHPYALLVVARNAVLCSMACLFLVARRHGHEDDYSDTEEGGPLLSNEGAARNGYGAAKSSAAVTVRERKGDAQSTGWVDYFYGFRVLFPYLWPSDSKKQQLTLAFCLFLLLLQRAVNILVPYQLGVLVGQLKKGDVPYKDVALYILYQSLQGQQGVIGAIRAIIWIPLSQSLFKRLTCAAFEHVLNLSLDFHLSNRMGEVMSALTKGSALNTFLDAFAFQLFPMVFDLWVAAVYFLIFSDAFYSLILLGVMWSYLFITIYMATYRGRARRTMASRDRDMDAAKADALMAYETVHHNSAIAMITDKFRQVVSAFQVAEYSVLFSLNGLNVVQNLIFTFGIGLIVLLSAFQISIGQHDVAFFVALLAYFNQLRAPLAFFGSFYNQVQNNLVDAERMLALFKQKPAIVDRPDAMTLYNCKGQITFNDVSFAYDPRKPALRKCSFVVEPGTSTAIVGESGSGKSTCLKLLFRFYEPNSGHISVDGHDIRSLKVASLRSYIGAVPQDTVLFNASLMHNLLFAKPDATEEEVYEACRAASIHDKIAAFPDGYETVVGERGLKLSGGEKQRIAIARAILKRPQIIMLDEATASLDSSTEKQIQGALEHVIRGRTNITIAHRLSTIVKANQILVLHQGEIVERGTHDQLLKLNGRYREMWERQTQQEEDGDQGPPLPL